MILLLTYPNKHPAAPSFFIQSKGENAGRPLKTAIANCFAVYSADEFLFEKVFVLFRQGKFKYYLIGSVIPFIRKKEVETVIKEAAKVRPEIARLIRLTDEIIEIKKQQISLLKQLQCSLK